MHCNVCDIGLSAENSPHPVEEPVLNIPVPCWYITFHTELAFGAWFGQSSPRLTSYNATLSQVDRQPGSEDVTS